MRKIDHLNGLKRWWNKYAKDKYKTRMTADEIKEECLSEWENTGNVEMRSYQSKDGQTHTFKGK